MISIVMWCHSRQEQLDICLPLWAKQSHPNYEIVLVKSEHIKLPDVGDTPITVINMSEMRLGYAYNLGIKAAKGDKLFFVHCDLKPLSNDVLSRMESNWKDKAMVTEKYFIDGYRNSGIWTQCLLVAKKDVEEIGGWCELFDTGYAYEDSDFMSCLLEHGCHYVIMESPYENSIEHIDHSRPVMDGNQTAKYAHNKNLYHSRHRVSIMELYNSGKIP